MNLVEFLQELSIKGWQIWSEGSQLRYDAPKEESTASVLALLKQHKTEILQLLHDNPDLLDVHPLSYGQQAMWFLWKLAPGSCVYNVSVPVRICSQVDVTAWRQAFQALCQRHLMLSSTFTKLGQVPIQQVHRDQDVDFLQVDASAWSKEELNQRVVEAHKHPFNLEKESAMRVRWFVRSFQEHILLLTIHHIACDGWSLDIIFQELPKLYQAQQTNVPASLPPLKYSYQDYVRAQRKILDSPRGEILWQYWKQKLAGELPTLNLPTDKPRPPIQTYEGAAYHFSLSEKLSQQLIELAQKENVTLYTLLLAVFGVFLYRYTGQEDILVGSPTSGRNRAEEAPIVGFFANSVVMRMSASENLSFKEFITKVQHTVLEAVNYQDYPFPLLVERLLPNRDPSRSPIFQVFFLLQQMSEWRKLLSGEMKTSSDWQGLKLEAFDRPTKECQFDFILEMIQVGSSLGGLIKYSTDLFEEQTIARMVEHFQTLLQAIVTKPTANIDRLPLLTATERQQCLAVGNNLGGKQGQNKVIYQLFEDLFGYPGEVSGNQTQLGEYTEVVPVGWPTDFSVYVLDSYGEPVPPGVTGEVYVGGGNLTESEINRTQQAPVSFVEHPELGSLLKTGERGCLRANGGLELQGFGQRWAWIKGHQVELQAIEKALLAITGVEDCYVIMRQRQLVAYVVTSKSFLSESLHNQLKTELPSYMLPSAYVTVSNLPLTGKGLIDESALAQLEVIDSELVSRWEEQLRSLPEIEQVAVVVQPQVKTLPRLHISDLVPSPPRGRVTDSPQVETDNLIEKDKKNLPQEEVNQLAISQGESLIDLKAQTLGEILQRAALENPTKGLVYIQADGTEFVQSYKNLLEEAQRLLGGLRKLGLKPQDKVIFQLADNQNFISAFWGCILGGFIPVPISATGNLNKLQNSWQMLGKPLVLSEEKLAPKLHQWAEELKLENFQIEPIEPLKDSEADRNWHKSKSEDLVLLLLTSGSTGMPKAVMHNHRSLLSRSASTVQFNGFSKEDISLNWFSLDHVGGIVMFHLRDVYLGCQQIHAPTELVLQEPTRWLDWISHYRATITWAPNFAYGLIVQELENRQKTGGQPENNQGWDLSSMHFILNAGEAIVAKTVRRFLEVLGQYQLLDRAMHPAWGMSETSSAVTFSSKFLLSSTTDEQKFVEVGSPVAGFAIRIVDNQNQIVKETMAGRVQVKGLSVTSGYYQNTEANQDAFTEDGWFNTGDIGFLRQGCLTITGRQKDIIIINGLNYYSHEIEATIEEIEGVEVSYTAACAVRDAESDTDKLAIFFNPAKTASDREANLLKEVRLRVVDRFGINPDYLIPVERDVIPKTAIGKIQRSQLKQRFESGEFNTILKRVDLLLLNVNTIPSWFYRKVWQAKVPVFNLSSQITTTLIFSDTLGLGTVLSEELEKHHQPSIQVSVGENFTKISDNHYSLVPDRAEHYQMLLEQLAQENKTIGQIVCLWEYDQYRGEISHLEALEQSQKQGFFRLLFLVKALEKSRSEEQSVQLLWVSSYSQSIVPSDKIAYEKGTVLGLLKTIGQEMTWLNCRHIDLPVLEVEVNKSYLWQELDNFAKETEVAYRDGKRLVCGIESVNLAEEPKQELPFITGGIYLISGGLGGIGTEIASFLLKNYQARLLIVGRTSLPDQNTWQTHLDSGNALARKIQAYQQLQQLPGAVIYEDVDICDYAQLQQLLTTTLSKWGGQLDGIIHLAGIFTEQLLVSQTLESFTAVLRPKFVGTWVLHKLLLEDNPQGLFLHFSSINGFFGGTTVGAYAAASSFMEAFFDYQQSYTSLQSYCLSWSMWDEIGMSLGYQMKDLTHAKGYFSINKAQGMCSLLAALSRGQHHLFVGLDGSKPNIERLTITSEPQNLQQLTAYFTSKVEQLPVNHLEALEVRDRFDRLSRCVWAQLAEMPLNETGEIVREKLIGLSTGIGLFEQTKPRNQVEHQLVEIFQQVLEVPVTSIHDNFFALGGNSLLAVQVVSRIQQTFNQEVSLHILFQSPTVGELGQTIIKENLLPGQKSDTSLPTLVPDPEQRYEPFPLTDIQQAYWLGRNQAFDLGNVASHIYIEIDSENLDIERLNQAWQKLVDHYDMLRAVVLPDGQQQVKQQVPPYQIQVFDLQNQPEPAVSDHLKAIREQMSHEILPSEQWPLFKLQATHFNEKHYRLHLSFDALIADSWSLMLLGQYWLQLYRDPESSLPSLELSFRDYVLAKIGLDVTPQYQRSQDYWFDRLSTLPPAPELPFAKQIVALEQPQFTRRSGRLNVVDWQRLKDKASQANLTNSTVLLAAFADILTCWSKSSKFTINLTLFNRLPLHPQVNEVLGDFTSLTLLEVDNSKPTPFIKRAQLLQEQLWQDLDHRYVSGVEVQRELRRLYGSYQAMGVVFTSVLGAGIESEEQLWVNQLGKMVYSISQTPQVWLDHQVLEEQGELIFQWDIVEELFCEGVIDNMFQSYTDYLQHLATSESAWMDFYPQLLPKAQLQQLAQLNQMSLPVPQQTLHGLFLQQVEQNYQELAVITPERCLTYGDLHQRACNIGHWLQQLGVSRNSLVAVVMFKGWEQVVAVLAILMAGAAYVPIDPELPQERREFLLTQGEVKVVLTQEPLLEQLAIPEGIECLSVDTFESRKNDSISFVPLHNPEDLAYVIYTSGSTGLPKGVIIKHQAVVNTILDINQRFNVTANDRILAVSALNFDLSVYDIFGLLAVGGTLVIPSAIDAKDPARWYELIVKHQVTLWNSVPALMQMLVEYLSGQIDQSHGPLRLALLSGDWIPLTLPERIKQLWSQIQIVSLGGATEASIWSIYYPIEQISPVTKSIPYGKSLANQTVCVLNDLMQPTPVWVCGDLYIGGVGLASGYLLDEKKTNASFITHPVTHERLYKTGDLGRYLPDGNIEFLGRSDFQVKINGYRVELGEIEAALSEHSTVNDTVVMALGDSEHKRLVAYVVPSEPSVEKAKLPGYSFLGGQIDPVQTKQVFGKPSEEDKSIPQQLHEHLQGKLPQYMLPNDYVLMDVFPLTANGKVNRKALPAPEVSVQKRSFQPPSTPIEEKLADIWATILELEVNQVGVNDNFFDLGGNSLLATQLTSRIRKLYQVDLPLSDFFEEPTIAGLVEHIEVISWMDQDIQYSETTNIKEIEL
ncbi:hypothetical protein BJP34_09730 [Moorena producens PAL-8-15-08-1]|uniref:Carrier domain-containing protein n=1 Tax=Moorena producens PAL-8-15-08-1 TaxID=1458985 RepID=A0A1D8TPV5_9CYAN|nr:non-ribosomal peptide synthetase [Moorena producens]AOW99700.1 hypothetical protein BJP34_09730 [Moorena producens PAL-8-15-08-1]